jgi:hypothetical protein
LGIEVTKDNAEVAFWDLAHGNVEQVIEGILG